MKVGTNFAGDSCDFTVWAPNHRELTLVSFSHAKKEYKMKKIEQGCFSISTDEVKPGATYVFRIDGKSERPDPASNCQLSGVNGPSCLIDHSLFQWRDSKWRGLKLEDMIMYEIHLGTFTKKGTFSAATRQVDELARIGVNTIELMPVAQFSGSRNWGYDGVFPFAVQNTYGGPNGLKQFVDHCHVNGLAVLLDVVFNHLGPEGNILGSYAPYFSHVRNTSWGATTNFDGPHCEGVRNYFKECALNWLENYHIDGLRLDAVHAIHDASPKHFVKELSETVSKLSESSSHRRYLIAESNANDPRLVCPLKEGGYGLDAQWLDDYHHAMHAVLTGETNGYYEDFGSIENLEKAILEGFVYTGQYSRYRGKLHGFSSHSIPSRRFVIFSQNHDQVGNRVLGERLVTLSGFEGAKVAAGLTLLMPYLPLLFMGEEYGENAPFLYFTNFSDQKLGKAVLEGRKREFASFNWCDEPSDPQNEETFLKSKINWQKRNVESSRGMLAYYQALIQLRKQEPSFRYAYRCQTKLLQQKKDRLLWIKRSVHNSSSVFVANLSEQEKHCKFPFRKGNWATRLDSSDKIFSGPGSLLPKETVFDQEIALQPKSVAIFLNSSRS